MIFFGYVVLIALAVVMRAWSVQTIWAWHIAPVFGLPLLTAKSALGLSLFAFLLTEHAQHDEYKGKAAGEKLAIMFGRVIIGNLAAVGMAWMYLRYA